MLARILAVVTIAALLTACTEGDIEEAGETVPRSEVADTTSAPPPAPPESVRAEPARPENTGPDGSPSAASTSPVSDQEAEETPAPRAAAPVVSPTGLHVVRAYVCKGIEESEPTEAGRSFIAAADGVWRLCCFSEIGGVAGSDTIVHVWYWGDREMARVELPVKAPRWRTWSNKRIMDEWRGEWHVDITDRQGTVLHRLEFSVE